MAETTPSCTHLRLESRRGNSVRNNNDYYTQMKKKKPCLRNETSFFLLRKHGVCDEVIPIVFGRILQVNRVKHFLD